MTQSVPVLPMEEDCDKWLSLEIFSSGLEDQPLLMMETQQVHPSNDTLLLDARGKGLQCHRLSSVSSAHDISQSFVSGVMSSDFEDEKVSQFLSLVQRYCRQRSLYLPHTDQIPDHPINEFGRLFMACLIKLHDLVPVAMGILEQEGPPNNEQDTTSIQLPASLADVCKIVYDAKVSLVKAHQESLCSYEEVCREPIARCHFIINNIRSPMLNVVSILRKYRVQVCHVIMLLSCDQCDLFEFDRM